MCSIIGNVIVKDLGEWNNTKQQITGPPFYTDEELKQKYVNDQLNKEKEKLAEKITKGKEQLENRFISKVQIFGDEDIVEIKEEKKEEPILDEIKKDVVKPDEIKKDLLDLLYEKTIANEKTIADAKVDIECPECKSKNIDALLHLENATRYKCKDCDDTFAIPKTGIIEQEVVDKAIKLAEEKKELGVMMQEKVDLDKPNKLAKERNRRLELVHKGFSVDDAKEIARKEIYETIARKEREANDKTITNEKAIMSEKRVVCGKPRSCKLVDGKVSEVFDNEDRKWKSFNEFVSMHGETVVKKEEPVDKEDKKEEKIADFKVDVPVTIESKVDLPNTVEIVNEGKKKITDQNIIEEYLELLYGVNYDS